MKSYGILQTERVFHLSNSLQGMQVAGNTYSWLTVFLESSSTAHESGSRGRRVFLNVEIWLWEGALLPCLRQAGGTGWHC